MSHQFGNQRMFAPEVIRDIGMGAIALGEIIDPLLKFDELFGDENARTLGVGLAYYCTDLSTGFLMRMEMLLEISCIDLVSQY